MKIAWLLDTYPSPSETFIARDIAGLRRHGLDIEIFALHAGPGARPIPAPKISPRDLLDAALHRDRSERFLQCGAAWWKSLGAEAATFGHIHAGWASHPALMAMGAAQASGLPWSFSAHARDIFVDGGDLNAKLQSARWTAVCTRLGARQLEKFCPDATHKIHFLPHGIDIATIPFSPHEPGQPPQLLAVGRLVEKKGFGLLLEAAAVLKAKNFALHLTILGDGPLAEDLKRRASRLGLGDTVTFAGAVAEPEVLSAMCTADCLVVPSIVAPDGDRDGLPNVILEAAACGLPIVATNAGAIGEFVDGETGFNCDSPRAEALAAAILERFHRAEQAASCRQAARRKVVEFYDLDRNTAVFAALFG